MAYAFGTGLLSLTPAGANPTPVNVGVLQDVGIDVTMAQVKLMGQYDTALDIAGGEKSYAITAKSATLDAPLIAHLISGATIAAGSEVGIQGESGTIPATPFEITVANNTTWSQDYGVWSTTNRAWMTRVASTPATGEYSVASGVYTFASADEGDAVKIYYSHTAAAIGQTVSVTNQLMGTGPAFQLALFNSYNGSSQGVKFYAVKSNKLTLTFASQAHTVTDIAFEGYANAAGQVWDFYGV